MKRSAIIIGAGYSGLSCAALLARDGWDVTVLEKNKKIGGRARIWKSKGYTFDMGPSWYLMPEVFDHFFELFGKKREDYFKLLPLDPYYKVFFSPEDHAELTPDPEKNRKLFESFEKGGAEALDRYTAQAKYKYDVAMSEFLYRDYKKLTEFFNRRLMSEGLKLNVFKKLDSYVSKYFTDRRAKQILEYAMVFLGTSPSDAPALYSIMSHVDLDLGVFFPEGGMAGVAEGIAKLCKELGVTIKTGQEVTEFELSPGPKGFEARAEMVKTQDSEYSADIIISGADYWHTEMELLPKKVQSYSSKYWEKRTLAPSMYIVYLGIGRSLKGFEHHNLYFAEDWNEHFDTIFKKPEWPKEPCFYISCISKTDTSTAPEGCENVFVLVPVAPGLDDSDEQREAYLDHVMEHIKNITGEDLRKDVQVKRVFTHRDFIQDYHAYKGTALGLSHNLMQTAVFRPSHRSRKVENLYYTGQYTHPGVGVPMTLIASEIVAEELENNYTEK